MQYLKKTTVRINFLFYALFWILISFNYNNPDYSNYKDSYVRQVDVYEPLYNALTKLFYTIGFSYEAYLPFLGILIIIFLGITISKYSSKHWIVLLAIIFSPLGLLITQIRSLLAYAVFFYGMTNLLDEYAKNEQPRFSKVLKYLIVVVACGTIQRTLLFYFVFIFAKKITPKKMIIPLGIFVVLFNFVFENISILLRIISFLDPIIPAYRAYYYLVKSPIRPNMNGLIATYTLYFVGLFIAIFLIRNEYRQDGIRESFCRYLNTSTTKNGIFFRCYLMVAAILPFCTIDTIFERLYFYLYPMLYMLLALDIENNDSIIRKRRSKLALFLIALFGLFYIIYVNGKLHEIIIPMFRDNYLLNPFALF